MNHIKYMSSYDSVITGMLPQHQNVT